MHHFQISFSVFILTSVIVITWVSLEDHHCWLCFIRFSTVRISIKFSYSLQKHSLTILPLSNVTLLILPWVTSHRTIGLKEGITFLIKIKTWASNQPLRQPWRRSCMTVFLGLSLLDNGGFIMFQYTAWAVCNPPSPHSCFPLNQDWTKVLNKFLFNVPFYWIRSTLHKSRHIRCIVLK